jgi:hypothetical protein
METEQNMAGWLIGDQINKERNQKFLESNESENTIYKKLWDTAKAMLKRKYKCLY